MRGPGGLAVVVVLCALAVAPLGCAQTVRVKAAPGSSLVVGDEPAVRIPDEGATDVQVPIGYLDPPFALTDDDGKPIAAGRLARTELAGLLAAPIAMGTLCAGLPLAGVGFCLANPELIAALSLSCLSPQLQASGDNALAVTLATPSWPTVPLMVLCAGSASLCLLALPLAMRVPDEIALPEAPPSAAPHDDDAVLPATPQEAMRW